MPYYMYHTSADLGIQIEMHKKTVISNLKTTIKIQLLSM